MERIWYELRVMRLWTLAVPVVIVAGMTLATIAIRLFTAHGDHHTLAQLMTATIEMLLPLGAAVVVASLTTSDQAMELRLTLPQPFALTALLRAALVIAASGAVAIVAGVFLYHWKFWRIPAQADYSGVAPQFLELQLTWLAPLLVLAALGFALAALLRNGALSGAVVGVVWLIESFAYGYFVVYAWLNPLFLFPTTLAPSVSFWLSSRLELIALALVLFLLGWLPLRRGESLIRSADAASE